MLRAKLRELGFGQYLPEEGAELAEELLRRLAGLSEVILSHEAYQRTKADFEAARRKAEEFQVEKQAGAAESRALRERVKALRNEADIERRATENAEIRIELAEKKLRNTVLENAEVSRMKDDRIKALIEENNLLSLTIDKVAARALHGTAASSDKQPLQKRVAEVQAICEELKRDSRAVEKLDAAFKKLEDKVDVYRAETIDLRSRNESLNEQIKLLERDLKLAVAGKAEAEQALQRSTDLYNTR